VIVPGTKQTLDDLRWLKESGFAALLQHRAHEKRPTVGLCGGLQMLGREVRDPNGAEGGGRADGLSLLPIVTELATTKTTVPASTSWSDLSLFGHSLGAVSARGYEIHMGETRYGDDARPFCQLRRAGAPETIPDGAVGADGAVIGTYVHGIFDADEFRHAFIRAARAACGLAPPRELAAVATERDARLNQLATHVENALDVDAMLAWVGLPRQQLATAGDRR
jgi:adenosylcobyric acid synthase